MGPPKIVIPAEHDSTLPRYVEDMADQLQRLMPGEHYRELRYFLDMAKLSARQTAELIERNKQACAEE